MCCRVWNGDDAMTDFSQIHQPVLLEECVGLVAPALERPGSIVVDCTLGLAGHACAFLKAAPEARLIGIDRDEPLNKVIAFGKSTGVTYPLGLDPGADIFAKYALRQAGITRNVLIDKEGRIVMLTRLYNPEEFSALVKKIDELLK